MYRTFRDRMKLSTNAALIVDVTGIVGIPLAEQLIQKKLKVYGISRRHADFLPSDLKHIALDATKKEDCKEKLKDLTDVTHVFFVTWVNSATEEEKCKVNKKLVSNIIQTSDPLLAKVTGVYIIYQKLQIHKFIYQGLKNVTLVTRWISFNHY